MPDNVRYRSSNTLCNESIVQTLHNKFDSCNESIVRRCRTSRNFPTSPFIRRCKKLLCATSLLADVVQQVRFCNESSPLGRRCRTSVTLQRVEPVWQTLQNKCDKNRNKIALHQGEQIRTTTVAVKTKDWRSDADEGRIHNVDQIDECSPIIALTIMAWISCESIRCSHPSLGLVSQQALASNQIWRPSTHPPFGVVEFAFQIKIQYHV